MIRDAKYISSDFRERAKNVRRSLSGRALRAAGEAHRRGFVESFDKGRFNDTGSRTWPTPKRKESGTPFPPPTKSHRTRATLIGSRGGGLSGLKGSFDVTVRGKTVIIENDKAYAAVHNEGGTIKMKVTKKMRSFAWAMWYKTKDESWKGLALTKKKTLTITIPQRKFMGHSTVIDKEAKREMDFIIGKHM